MAKAKKNTNEPIEKQLWKAADKLRKNIDAAEYKHIVLGLIFLRYISDAFEELFEKLEKGEGKDEGADPEDKDEYTAKHVFFENGGRCLQMIKSCRQQDNGSKNRQRGSGSRIIQARR